MNSPLPKVLHRVGGRTMLDRVVSTLRQAGAEQIVAVIGFGRQAVTAELEATHPGTLIAVQEEQLGTGHAVQTALPLLPHDARTIGIFSGDTPLLTPRIVGELAREHRERQPAVTLLTAELDDPSGYGRIMRTADGLVERIVEEKDADSETRAIREVNAGAYIYDRRALIDSLGQVSDENKQGEFYLTDTIDILTRQGAPVAALVATGDPSSVLGVNTVEQLLEAEMLLKEREENP